MAEDSGTSSCREDEEQGALEEALRMNVRRLTKVVVAHFGMHCVSVAHEGLLPLLHQRF